MDIYKNINKLKLCSRYKPKDIALVIDMETLWTLYKVPVCTNKDKPCIQQDKSKDE